MMTAFLRRLAGIYGFLERCSPAARVAMIVSLGVLLRMLASWEGYKLIARDGLVYLKMGHLIGNGHFVEGLNFCPDILPLYPMLLGLGVKCGLSAYNSVFVLSLTAGILIMLPAALLAEELFGPKNGLLGLLFVACAPALVEFSGEATRETTFLCFFAAGVYFSAREIKYGHRLDAALAGLMMSFSFLVRREGLLLFAATGIILLQQMLFSKSGGRINRLVNFIIYAAAWGLVMALFFWLLRDTRMGLLNIPKLMRFVNALY